MTDLIPIDCEARLMGLSKVDRKDGEWTQLILQIHPNDTPYALFLLPLKTHIKLSISGVDEAPAEPADAHTGEPEHPPDPRLDDAVAGIQKPADEQPAPEATPTPQEPEPRTLPLKERRPWGELSATTQAVLACKRDDFQRWICLKNGNTPPSEDNAAWHVKQFCGVTSRSHLTTTGNADRLWCGLWDDFKDYSEGRGGDAQATQLAEGPR